MDDISLRPLTQQLSSLRKQISTEHKFQQILAPKASN